MLCIVKKKTLQIILDTGNHYVVQVKANQKKLLEQIIHNTRASRPIASSEEYTKARGRRETRIVRLYDELQGISCRDWCGLQRIIVVERTRQDKHHTADSVSYFLSSFPGCDAGFFAKGIRQHWLIENKLHYVKDVVLQEDASTITKHIPAANMSLLKNFALNLMRNNGFESIKYATISLANKINKLYLLMRT